jgi:hypothetical protein
MIWPLFFFQDRVSPPTCWDYSYAPPIWFPATMPLTIIFSIRQPYEDDKYYSHFILW